MPRTLARGAQQASEPGIAGVLGVSAMDDSVTVTNTAGASVVHGRCSLVFADHYMT
jgi:hypothetical protein